MTQKLPGTGPGPMLGGSAGGQDYSLSSMLERAPYKTKEDHGTDKRSSNRLAILLSPMDAVASSLSQGRMELS